MTADNESTPAPPTSPAAVPSSQRLMSLDALRGFDMFWILGADAIMRGLRGMSDSRLADKLATQLEHAKWEGFRFNDLIFPLFVFIVGVSVVFSLSRLIEREGRAAAVKRIVRRSVLLFALGLFSSGGFANTWPNMRLMGVLNQIALGYLFTGILFCFLRPRGLVAACVLVLGGYWAMMTFVPFPDVRPTPDTVFIGKENGFTNIAQLNLSSTNLIHGTFIKGVNLANYVDQKFLPGRKYDGTWDPEGLLGTLGVVGSCLLGVLAGLLLKNPTITDRRKVALLVGLGVAGVALGWLWGLQFPVIKKIWTSSYVLVAGGYSAILLGVFYLIVDVWKRQTWCQPFVWIGMNAITVYVGGGLIGFRGIATKLAGGGIQHFLNTQVTRGLGDMLISLIGLLLAIGFCHFLYKRKIFLRL
jgi:predicted acyltransferase